jgi:IS30 family transposase
MADPLAWEERTEINRRYVEGDGVREIARALGRSPSTVSRELRRDLSKFVGDPLVYNPLMAQWQAQQFRRRPQKTRCELDQDLRDEVRHKLRRKWSPRQISRHLRLAHPDEPKYWVSAKSIYKTLYVQGRCGLNAELKRHRREVKRRRPDEKRGNRPGIVMISERPSEADDRAVPGHWEGDLIIGGDGRSALMVLVERSTRFTMLAPLPKTHDAESTRRALVRTIRRLPESLQRSLTWDQGTEMAQHKQFSIDTRLQVYFCEPGKPWQRGTNENTNRLLRDWFPKGHNFTNLSARRCRDVEDMLNERPRMTLDWRSPAEAYAEAVALTG